MQNIQYRWVKVQRQANNTVLNKKDHFRKIPLEKEILLLLNLFYFPPEIPLKNMQWIKISGDFLIGMTWTLEQSWPVSSLQWDVYTIVPHEWACTCQISSQINATISADWPLQKESTDDNKAEILRNLNRCTCPGLEGMQKRHSVNVSALYSWKRQTPHWFLKLCRRIPSTSNLTKDNTKQQPLSLGFYKSRNLVINSFRRADEWLFTSVMLIFNASWNTGEVLGHWQEAKKMAIVKKVNEMIPWYQPCETELILCRIIK